MFKFHNFNVRKLREKGGDIQDNEIGAGIVGLMPLTLDKGEGSDEN